MSAVAGEIAGRWRGSRAGLLPARSVLRVFALSRLVVLAAAVAATTLIPRAPTWAAADWTGISAHLGSLGNVLGSAAIRWDALWYLRVASHGYRTLQETGRFPLYPLLIRVGSLFTGSTVIAAVVISVAATCGALLIVWRLTLLELGPEAARATVWIMAFAPFALYLSAAYNDGLFIALSAGSLYCARRGRWGWAGVIGFLASLTRINGLVLAAPLLVLFLYGPRDDEPPGGPSRWLRARYRLDPRVLFVLLVPAGTAAFCAYTALRGFGFVATFRAQHLYWAHHFTGPVIGVWDGVVAARGEIQEVLSGAPVDTQTTSALFLLGLLLIAVTCVVGVFRRLPLAYGVYALLAVVGPLSSPTIGDPLRGTGRYESMIFPLFMFAGAWAAERRRLPLVLGISVVLLVTLTAQFATWHWVGAPLG